MSKELINEWYRAVLSHNTSHPNSGAIVLHSTQLLKSPFKSEVLDEDDIILEPWPEDWVDPYYASCFGGSTEEEEEDDWDEDWTDDDDYSDEDFIDDTGAQIKDAPALDIL
jgi:hypothetical protein